MKAKTSDNNPYGWDVFVYDDKNNPIFLLGKDYTRKSNADELTNEFNSALSAHVAKETEKLQSEIAELKAEVQKIDYEYRNMTRKYKKAIDEVEGLKAEVERLKGVGHTPESELNELSKQELIERLIASQSEVARMNGWINISDKNEYPPENETV